MVPKELSKVWFIRGKIPCLRDFTQDVMWVSNIMEVPQNGWLIRVFMRQNDDWGYPHFRKGP